MVAHIACTSGGTRLLTPAVRPQSDGLHVILSQTGGPPATLQSERAGGWKPGRRAFVITLPPGPSRLGCMTMADWNADPPRHRGWVTLRIVDQNGLWVDDRPVGGRCSEGSLDYTATATGAERAQLAALAGKALHAPPAMSWSAPGTAASGRSSTGSSTTASFAGWQRTTPMATRGWLLGNVERCSSG